MNLAEPSLEERILVLAPTGADAENAVRGLQQSGFRAERCGDLSALCARARVGGGALLLAEEALVFPGLPALRRLLDEQPSWSDIPLIVITSGGDTTHASMRALNAFGTAGNITLIERPFRLITLVSALQVALRARRRQYQVRDLLKQQQRNEELLVAHARELEKRVEERTARLAETISELEAFSYSVSHDLRAPLRTMQGYSFFLLQDAANELNEDCRGYLQRIAAAAARLDTLVQDILTYSRVARADIRLHAIDLERLIDDIVAQYPEFHAPRAEVKVMRPLPRVMGHEASLTQCVSNLLSNAAKFVARGTKPLISIRAEEKAANVRVWFEDNGVGIEPAFQARMFKMFEKGHSAQGYEGTGIGLAIVRKAVERMGGEVGVESAPGAGSRFWIELPKA